VDLRKKTVTYFDSMGGNNDEACRILLQYLQQESKDKKGKDLDTSEWTLQSKKRNVRVTLYLTRDLSQLNMLWHFTDRCCHLFEKSISSHFSQQEIPQQMNGSDCGMFTCKYAEYITKDKPITFTQVSTSTANLSLCLLGGPVFNTILRCFEKVLFDKMLNLAFTTTAHNAVNNTFINGKDSQRNICGVSVCPISGR
jgi:hypothetical protein